MVQKTSSKDPSAWQVRNALESVSISALLPDSELLICLEIEREQERQKEREEGRKEERKIERGERKKEGRKESRERKKVRNL